MLRSALRPITRAIRSVVGTNGLAESVADLDRRLIAATNNFPSSSPQVTSSPLLDVSYLMHDSRGALLRGMPSGAQRLLSAGCAGKWYFDWIEQTYGRVQEHLGIEYYMPKPEGLADNVTWITNTASDMSGVDDASCDLVFSGQNLEHLWPEEVSGFLLEGARVLKPGGHVVIDSPNRLLTAPLNWSHPEHTIELT
ncbi:methyltransferase domain-containing protein, partial [Phyllobacterium sp. P5_D12]